MTQRPPEDFKLRRKHLLIFDCKESRDGATKLIQTSLDKKDPSLTKHLSKPLDEILPNDDRTFLCTFLGSNNLKNILTLIDAISRITQTSAKSPNDKASTNFHALISKLRPHKLEDRNCLIALNDAWNEIEGLLTRHPDGQHPDAQELYDILADDFIRELLVAVDDTGNYRYTAYVHEDSAVKTVYVEEEPAFVAEDNVDGEGTLDQPFSPSTLTPDDEPSALWKPSEEQDSISSLQTPEQLEISSQSPSVSPSRQLPQPPPRTSSKTSHYPRPLVSRTSQRVKNGSPSSTGLRRREKSARSKHPALSSYVENSLPEPGKLRTVYINRSSTEEPLGITLIAASSTQTPTRSGSLLSLLGRQSHREEKKDPPKIIIQRIIVGSLADKERKLFPGDEVVEFNGVVATSLEDIQREMAKAAQNTVIQLLVRTPGIGQLKAYLLSRNCSEQKIYIRCFFNYDPMKDALLPNMALGVPFRSGDVLELVDSQDLNWWQVRRLDAPDNPVGLVPSQTLEERRQAFNQQASAGTGRKAKKVKSIFRAADPSNLLVRSDLWVYEEVFPWPPSPLHTLLLIGPNGVGRRTLKFLLSTQFPQKFSFPISDTTDATAAPTLFRVRTREDMEGDIRQGAYVEWGTVDGHHYGIRFSAIREIIAAGRTAVVDCQCQSVYLLHQPEFNPHVVFVSAPNFATAKAMMEAGLRNKLTVNNRTDAELGEIVEESKIFAARNQHLYTHTLVNSDMAESVEKLSRLVSRLEKRPGWIPAGWAYEMGLPKPPGKNGKAGLHFPNLDIPPSSGVPGLGADNQSVLGRASNSVLSGASQESAVRLARPPSVCSSLQLPKLETRGGYGGAARGRWRYEKRGTFQRAEVPLSPLSSAASSESGDTNSPPAPNKGKFVPKSAMPSQVPSRPIIRKATPSEPSELNEGDIVPANQRKSNASPKSTQEQTSANKDDGDDEISSTSSEE